MNPDLKDQYVDFIKQYEELEHMTRLTNSELTIPYCYILHQNDQAASSI